MTGEPQRSQSQSAPRAGAALHAGERRQPSVSAMSDRRLPQGLAAWIVVGLWLPYCALNTVFPGPQVTYALGLALAALGLGTLRLAGVALRASFVRLPPLSRQGARLLAPLLLVVPLALLTHHAQPLRWRDDLIYAPASALAQELYFRAILLTALTYLCSGRERAALLLQAGLFALWHVRAFEVVPWELALGVLVATGTAGLLWGREAQRDRTMLYAAAVHILLLIVL
jgi:hypothetical protein